MNNKRKAEVRTELQSAGYRIDYINSWPPKIDMWWHRDTKNPSGDVVSPVGTAVPNQPGHPDHQARKSRMGLLPWPPSESCMCKSCRERREVPEALVEAPLYVKEETAVKVARGRPKGKSGHRGALNP